MAEEDLLRALLRVAAVLDVAPAVLAVDVARSVRRHLDDLAREIRRRVGPHAAALLPHAALVVLELCEHRGIGVRIGTARDILSRERERGSGFASRGYRANANDGGGSDNLSGGDQRERRGESAAERT